MKLNVLTRYCLSRVYVGWGFGGGGAVSGISMNLMIANDGRVKVESCGRQDGSVGKGECCQAWGLSWVLGFHGGKKELLRKVVLRPLNLHRGI